jgi:hypothetical protein
VDISEEEFSDFNKVVKVYANIKNLVNFFERSLLKLPSQARLSFVGFKTLMNELMKDQNQNLLVLH